MDVVNAPVVVGFIANLGARGNDNGMSSAVILRCTLAIERCQNGFAKRLAKRQENVCMRLTSDGCQRREMSPARYRMMYAEEFE